MGTNESSSVAQAPYIMIVFQNGPRGENGINGCFIEDVLIDVLIPRLERYQSGPFPCSENAVALDHFKSALIALHGRTLRRVQQGVEGKNIAHV